MTTSHASRTATIVGLAWILLIGVTAVGHVTALRNTLTVVVSLVTLGLYLRDWRALPCKAIVASLVVWATASVLWSPAPDVTLGKLRTDLLLPLLAGIAAFCFARQARGLRFVVAGTMLGVGALAILSLFAYLPVGVVPSSWPMEQAGGIVRPLPHWYPGPGDASMFAILAIAPLCMAWRLARDRRMRGVVALAGLSLALVAITTNNRNAVLIAPVVVLFQWLLDRRVATVERRPSTTARVARVVGIALIAAIALGAVLEIGARQRLAYLHKPMVGDSAALELVASDTRPVIWRYYFARGLEHPWIGMGFGRTVPGIGWRTESDRELAQVEPNAYIHAHDLALNWWLQLGVVGLALLGAALASCIAVARRLERAAGRTPRARFVEHALFATLFATAARNLTDDFLVYGIATAFCVLVAAMLGDLSRLAAERAAREGAVTSLRSRSAPS